MSNNETERIAIEFVMDREQAAGREPQDLRLTKAPYDILSPPRKIEVKAFGGSARGAPVALEQSQVTATQADPENFYVYVVDNVARADHGEMAIHILHGQLLRSMIDRTTPHATYWSTLRAAEYDSADRLP